MAGLERYSHEAEGAIYSVNWIFPLERYTKGGMGLNTYPTAKEPVHHFAKRPTRMPKRSRSHWRSVWRSGGV